MKSTNRQTQAIPLHDYGTALRKAVSWLGERHLLAEPVRRLGDERRSWYHAQAGWHPQSTTAR